MGKRITQQARGKGGPAFCMRKKAYKYKISYPKLKLEGNAKVMKLINSPAHTAPLAKISIEKESFIIPAAKGLYEGKEIKIGKDIEIGNIVKLKDIPAGTKVFNIESKPGGGGKYLRTAGSFGTVTEKDSKKTEITMTNKRKIKLAGDCRAIIGVVAGDGRLTKPIVKAGKKHHMMKAIGRKWHRTSAVKVNAIDHPFGGGRGKRIKSKISKRNSAPGQKVGHIRPRRTGKK